MDKVLQFKPLITALLIVGTAGTLVMKNKPEGEKALTPGLDKNLAKVFPAMAIIGGLGFLAMASIESVKR